jgi:adenylate cyclase
MQERRLAAIMFTDIVGYTALMGSDEDRAFKILRKNREIHSKLIQQFCGTLIKEIGDGMLPNISLFRDHITGLLTTRRISKRRFLGKKDLRKLRVLKKR